MTTIESVILGNTLLALAIAVAAWSSDRMFRTPMLAHCLWVLVLVKLLTPPIASLPIAFAMPAWPSMPPHVLESSPATYLSIPAWLSWGTAFSLVWLIGSILLSIRIVRASKRVHWLIEHRGRFDIGATRELQMLSTSKNDETPEVWLVDAVISPMLVSPLIRHSSSRARIAFPKKLWQELDEDSRGLLLQHELEHWRRRDWIVRLVEVISLV